MVSVPYTLEMATNIQTYWLQTFSKTNVMSLGYPKKDIFTENSKSISLQFLYTIV